MSDVAGFSLSCACTRRRVSMGGIRIVTEKFALQLQCPTLSGCLVQKLRYAYLKFEAAILNFHDCFLLVWLYNITVCLAYVEPLEFRCYIVYTLRFTYLKFRGLHFGFSTTGSSCLVVQHCHHSYWIGGPRKQWLYRWNLADFLFTN